jgi:hypothetical protein
MAEATRGPPGAKRVDLDGTRRMAWLFLMRLMSGRDFA